MKLTALILALTMAVGTYAATYDNSDTENVEWDEVLNTPTVPVKANAAISRHMETLSKWFKQHGLNSHLTRKNEVVLVTVEASRLFAPNSTDLLADADNTLSLFGKALGAPTSYRLLVAVHTDDTGDEIYSDYITEARAQAIHNRLIKIAEDLGTTPNIYFASFGNERPLGPNNSIDNRAKNRRIEFYLVPEQPTIDAARSGRL